MSNSYEKYLELEEEGVFNFDPNNVNDVLNLARQRGLRQEIMLSSLDIVRENTNLTNEQAILKSAKKWNVI